MKQRLFSRVVGIAFAGVLAACSLPPGSPGAAPPASLAGIISYGRPIALPPDAVLVLRLFEFSPGDASIALIAEQRQRLVRSGSISFALPYDAAAIDQTRHYALTAEILEQDWRLFTSDSLHPVLTRGHGREVEVVLVPVR